MFSPWIISYSAWWVSNWLLNNLVSYYKCDTNWSFPDAHWSNNWTINWATYTASWKINGWYSYATNDYVSMTDDASFKMTTSFTVSAWIKSTDTTNVQCIFSYLNTDSANSSSYWWYLLRIVAWGYL